MTKLRLARNDVVDVLDAYRADPTAGDLAPLRQQVIARTQVWFGEEVDPYTLK